MLQIYSVVFYAFCPSAFSLQSHQGGLWGEVEEVKQEGDAEEDEMGYAMETETEEPEEETLEWRVEQTEEAEEGNSANTL